MDILQINSDFNNYLEKTNIIDYDNEEIVRLALKLKSKDTITCIRNCFNYVRDYISHIADISGEKVVCNASDVLKTGYGDCCAKSHLLVALLRYNEIPSGFCYQKLILDDEKSPYLVIHGLVGVYVLNKWMRIDARGNKEGVNAEFIVGEEKIAYKTRKEFNEEDIPFIYAKPDKNVIYSLVYNKTFEELWENLPRELSKK